MQNNIAGENVKWYGCSEKVWQFLLKLKIDVLDNLAFVLLSTYPKEMKMYFHTETCT